MIIIIIMKISCAPDKTRAAQRKKIKNKSSRKVDLHLRFKQL